VLAGFSVTVVIVVTDDAKNFRWPGEAILALTVAALALIVAFQLAKYARGLGVGGDRPKVLNWWTKRVGRCKESTPEERIRWFWRGSTRGFYHFGLTALLAGLAFALAPYQVTTRMEGTLRWTACGVAFGACLFEALLFATAGRADRATNGQGGLFKSPQLVSALAPCAIVIK
jgi:hypothetical protein